MEKDIQAKHFFASKTFTCSHLSANDIYIKGRSLDYLIEQSTKHFDGNLTDHSLTITPNEDGGGITIQSNPDESGTIHFDTETDHLWKIEATADNTSTFRIVNEQTNETCLSIDGATNVVNFPFGFAVNGHLVQSLTFTPTPSIAYANLPLLIPISDMAPATMSVNNVLRMGKAILVGGSLTFVAQNNRNSFFTSVDTSPIMLDGETVADISGLCTFFEPAYAIGSEVSPFNSSPKKPRVRIVNGLGNLRGNITMDYLFKIILN